MKTILCYGDSNTWGCDPATYERFPKSVRWTGALARELGDGYEIVEEGLNGRTTLWDDPIEGYKNGKEYLIPCLESHKPIDLVTLLLGTNDLKKRFSVSAYDIAQSVAVLAEIVLRSNVGPRGGQTQLLLMAPPIVGKLTEYTDMFEDAAAKSSLFPAYYRRVAEQFHCHFMEVGQFVVSSDRDGIHWEASEHQKLGRAVAARVKEIFKDNDPGPL